MDFHTADLHMSVKLDNSYHFCIVVHRVDVNIQHMDFQATLAYMYTLVDVFVLRNVHFLHKNQYHRLYGIHDSIDRMLHHPNNLHCIGKFHVRTISMGFLVYRPDKYNWLDGFVPNILHHVRIEFHRMCMD